MNVSALSGTARQQAAVAVCGISPLRCGAMRATGFTLIELLIVMLIVSVMIAVATLTLKRDYQDLLAEDANRLQALVALARDEALFQARSLGLRFNEHGYDFMIRGRQPGRWEVLDDKSFRPRKLGKGVYLEVFRKQTPLELQEKAQARPHVFILSTGEVTPFRVEFVYPARARLSLAFDALGQAKRVASEEF